MIKAIIFDCFGVLADSGWDELEATVSLKDDEWGQISPLIISADLGHITMSDFVSGVSKIAGIRDQEFLEILQRQRPNSQLLNYIDSSLKKEHKVSVLSNVGKGYLSSVFDKNQLNIFDDVVASSDVGMVKPDARIYRLAAERLGVEPDECIFIDDSHKNVIAAEAVGMTGHLYQGVPALKMMLKSALTQTT